MSSSPFPSAPPPRHADDTGTSVLSCILIIVGLLAFVLVASLSISACLRHRSNRSRPSPSPPPSPPHGTDDGKKDLIDSLPRFTMASALAALPRSSPDCAVCLSPFRPEAELRLLPACRHAFHAVCVDAWLRTTPTCPLCRATVAPPHPSIAALLAAQQQQQPPPPPEPAAARGRDRSSRFHFRVEMGSVSSRGGSPAASTGSDDSRTYSLGSFEYHIDEEVEAVVSRMVRAAASADTVKEEKPAAQGSPSPPGEAVAEAAGTTPRGWLREYMDRLASSASSFSYSFSDRWSSRWSQGQQGHRQEEPWLWDAEAATVPPPPPPGTDEEVETTFMVLYRWIAAV
ncbi:E3 ubiquitin-protein ligase ATL4-like [Hordeum vulgare subsp. vulgare]|uniref:RING-type domain-containing protein n=1 Tax=Hordeum vulgare subsp. vulgare TaxID=112509 RepID=A0A8I6XHW5_HORVV|nr:E3 ubiquitin-protein ligase ATL4-like [Hordeum vulgare subsp. vulgare]